MKPKILIVDDSVETAQLLREGLRKRNYDAEDLNSAKACLERLRFGQIDIILTDFQMPEMNGVDATLAIRRAESRRGLPRTPILAVSANVMTHQINEYLAAGMDAVVAKPVQAAVLFAEMQKALSDRGGAPIAQAVG